jgi:hypothetical protein
MVRSSPVSFHFFFLSYSLCSLIAPLLGISEELAFLFCSCGPGLNRQLRMITAA